MRLLLAYLIFCCSMLPLLSQDHIYFAPTQPETFTDLYVTPDEQLLVIKSAYNVVVHDTKTGKRLHRWILPQKDIQTRSSNFFHFPYGTLLSLPNNFLEQYGPDVYLLATDGKRAQSHYLTTGKSYGGWIGFDSKVKNYVPVPQEFVGYGYDGRAVYAAGNKEDGCPEEYWKYRKANTYTYYQTDEKGERQIIVSCARSGQLVHGGRYFYYITNATKKKNPNERWLYDMKEGTVVNVEDLPGVTPLITQKGSPRYIRPYYTGSSEGYLLIGPGYPPTEKQWKLRPGDYLYQLSDGKIIPAKTLGEIPDNHYVSANYRWQPERITVTDEQGTYEATGIRQYDKTSMQPVRFIQLTKGPVAQATYDSIQVAKKETAFADAVARREARLANAIAVANGKETWRYEKETQRYYESRSKVYAQYTTEAKVSGKLSQYIVEGDEVYLPGAQGSRRVQEVDREHNMLVFGRPGATVRSQDETQYFPLKMTDRICLLETRKVDVGKTVDCPACLGGKVQTGTVIDRNAKNDRPYYFSGYDSQGRMKYTRRAMTKPVYGTCGRCNGSGTLNVSNVADRRTYRCLSTQ
ncbi:MAG: hypothetical protein AAGI38_11835 [Bacteroidota bacterium]